MLCNKCVNHYFGVLLETNTEFHVWHKLLAAMTPHRAVHPLVVQTQDGIRYSLTSHHFNAIV